MTSVKSSHEKKWVKLVMENFSRSLIELEELQHTEIVESEELNETFASGRLEMTMKLVVILDWTGSYFEGVNFGC